MAAADRGGVVERAAQFARLDHPLLAVGLKIPDHLGNQADQLARDVSDVLLGQLTLLPGKDRSAERCLELRPAKLLTKRRHPALQRCVLQLRLALQHADDLRHDWQDLSDDFVDVLLAQQPRRLTA